MKQLTWIAGIVALSLCRFSVAADGEKIDVKVLEKSLDNALKAYNDDDHKSFWAEFSKQADPFKTKETYDSLYTNGYKKTFGKLIKRGDLIKDKSVLEGKQGLVSYGAEFEKDKKVEIDAHWVLEGKGIKFIQIQMGRPKE